METKCRKHILDIADDIALRVELHHSSDPCHCAANSRPMPGGACDMSEKQSSMARDSDAFQAAPRDRHGVAKVLPG